MMHGFEGQEAMPVRVGFAANSPLAVQLGSAGRPLAVDMRMLLAAPRTIPICFSLCEAICADSDYTIGLTLFDRPVITIKLRGRTRIFSED